MRIWLKISLAFSIIVISIALLGYFVVYQLNTVAEPFKGEIPSTIEQIQKTSILNGYAQSMKYYDEVLTQSARNYAFTQDKKWEERYRMADPALDLIIRDAIKKGDARDSVFFSNVNDANIALLKMEYASLELVDQGHKDDAIKILESKEYWDQKKMYQQGLMDYVARHGSDYDKALEVHTLELDKVTTNTLDLIENETNIISIFIPLTLILSIIIGFVIASNISKPISSLRVATAKITNGDFNARVSVTGNDEISDLSTDVNKMALTLRKSQRETKDIMNLLDRSSLVSITDKSGNIIHANDIFCKVAKYTKEELIGSSHRIIKSGFHPPEFYKNIWKTISSGNMWQGEIKNKAKDGTFYWVRTLIAPIFDDGVVTPVRYISIRSDITVEKELQEKNLKIEKLSVIGELSARLAHDLRNPLSVIMNTIQILKLKSKNGVYDENIQEKYARIERAIARMSYQIEDVLDFVRIKPLELGNHSIVEIIKEVSDKMTKPNNIKINLPQNDLKITCDSKKLEIVFINIITNAIQSIGDKGEITIKITDDKDNTCISIEDSGPGIADEILPKIFEPLFTTKQMGTGLGLVSCRNIVEQHGGRIWAKSEVGKGTTMHIVLPTKMNIPQQMVELIPR